MDDLPRILVGLLWCLVMGLFLRGGRSGGSGTIPWVLVAALLAACALARLHVVGLRWVRELLRAEGIYDGRMAFKIAIGMAVAAGVGVAAWKARPAAAGPPHGARYATLGALAYIIMQTAFLDDLLPAWVASGPGRYALEASFAITAIVSLMRGVPRVRGSA